MILLKPIIKELGSIFNNLSINKIKSRKGRKIEYLEFIFDAEKRIHSKQQPKMTDVSKEPHVRSREKTPNWLNKSRDMREVQSEKYDQDLEYNRKEFLKQLEKDWEE
ncbi:hypothetical protein [Staphylococcus hominis]|uniref:hypothetical protein n=1 Tax=Staphylococcus hominis TaxID=1290 RepID=UPI003D007D50